MSTCQLGRQTMSKIMIAPTVTAYHQHIRSDQCSTTFTTYKATQLCSAIFMHGNAQVCGHAAHQSTRCMTHAATKLMHLRCQGVQSSLWQVRTVAQAKEDIMHWVYTYVAKARASTATCLQLPGLPKSHRTAAGLSQCHKSQVLSNS